MNRMLVLGVAVFFALVGLAMIGGESKAVAGHGCHGCEGVGCVGNGGGCGGAVSDCCGKRMRCAGRRHARKARCGGMRKHRRRCGGYACGGHTGGGCGGHVVVHGGGKGMMSPVQNSGGAPVPPAAK